MVEKRKINRRRGESLHPIRVGAVFKLHRVRRLQNPNFNYTPTDHFVYLWIHKIPPNKPGLQGSKRELTVVLLYVPIEPTRNRDMIGPKRKDVQWEYITRKLKNGYDDLGDVAWDYDHSERCYKNFFRTIGFLVG